MEDNRKPPSKIWIVALIACIAMAVALYTVQRYDVKRPQDYLVFFKEIRDMVKAKYVEPVDNRKLMISAINGMLASLDPHSDYMPPEAFNDMQIQMSGTFGGLGMEVTVRDGKLTVISPIEDTPAFHAGIRSGDYIWMIDKALTRSMGISDAVKRMRGPKGSVVVLTILREGVRKPIVLTLKRDIIRIRSVKSRLLEKGFGYVRITQFQETTGEEFKKALAQLQRENGNRLEGLVLDLRNNPGGVLESAVDVAGRFIGGDLKGGLIVTIKGRDASSIKEYFASVGEKEPPYPLAVMINGGSASASEIVAGALQDHRRAIIVGTQSFGKGSVQSIILMKGGAGLKLTTARYYTPKGRSIQVKGITPDIVINPEEVLKPLEKKSPDFREVDLDNHILSPDNVQKKEEIIPPGPRKSSGEEKAGEDYQLSRVLNLLKGIELLGRLR